MDKKTQCHWFCCVDFYPSCSTQNYISKSYISNYQDYTFPPVMVYSFDPFLCIFISSPPAASIPPLPRFISMKFKAVTFIDSFFLNCYFEDVSSVGSFFKNCTFEDSFFYNTGKSVKHTHLQSVPLQRRVPCTEVFPSTPENPIIPLAPYT